MPVQNQMITPAQFPKPFPNITEKKKADLDRLALEVLDAQSIVDQYTAIVTALTAKSNKFQAFLADADSKRTSALANFNSVHALKNMADNLCKVSAMDQSKMLLAKGESDTLANLMKKLIDKLIYSVDLINRLNGLAVKQKAVNPLVSDDLISRLLKASTDANNTVALCLVALKSAYAAQATTSEALATTTLEQKTAQNFLDHLTIPQVLSVPPTAQVVADQPSLSLQALIEVYYKTATNKYNTALAANNETTNQLTIAQQKLSRAQIKLKALQAGLAAATAAAYAS